MINSYLRTRGLDRKSSKRTISLPPELAGEIEMIAEEGGKTVSAVIQDALRSMRKQKLKPKRAKDRHWMPFKTLLSLLMSSKIRVKDLEV